MFINPHNKNLLDRKWQDKKGYKAFTMERVCPAESMNVNSKCNKIYLVTDESVWPDFYSAAKELVK